MNCIIVYTSMTGNTEAMAMAISRGLRESGVDLVVKDSLLTMPAELMDYDGILLGSYTWNDGELPDEFLDFYEEMDQMNLSGKRTAAFGSGASSYPHFCKAVDLLNKKMEKLGAEAVLPGLKVEGNPNRTDIERCIEFGREFGKKLAE